MQVFYYRAKDRKGQPSNGQIEAESVLEAKRLLSARDLIVLEVSGKASDRLAALFEDFKKRFLHKVSLEEMIVFNRQLQTSYSVGISMLQALKLIRDQTQNPQLAQVLDDVILEVTQGKSLHEAFGRHPRVFDPIYVNAIKAGESSGKLEQILDMLSYFAEQRMENEQKVKSATFYPKIIMSTIVLVLLVVTYFVIPKIKVFYDRFGGQLPDLTLMVLAVSDFFTSFWFLILPAAIAAYIGFRKYIETPKGKEQWHYVLLKTPVFGQIFLQSDLLTFATVLQLLVKSGIPVLESFKIVENSLSNQIVKNEIGSCRKAIEEGKDISHGFRQSRVLPKMLGNLLTVGEEGGRIDEVLGKIASYYKLQLEYRLNNLSKAIEPAFLFLIFGLVLILVLAIFLPIWKMSQLVRMR